jgi:hypothetical protein
MDLATLDPKYQRCGVLEHASEPRCALPTNARLPVMATTGLAGMCARMFGARTGTRTCLALGQTWPRNGAS